MKIYTLRIVLRGVSPMIWRRLKVPGHTSLADLHYIIQAIYGWDDENLHQFHIYGKDYGINYVGSIGYSDNVHEVYLDDFVFDAGDKFSYEYNFFDHLMHDIRVERIEESTQIIQEVSCTKGSGMLGADKHEEIRLITKLLKIILDKTAGTRNDMIRLIDKLEAIRFNKKLINKKLNEIKSEHL
ncbi:MAG: plasmid pRiA4b ORF-3 family protein [Alphaproteobacteria bacterium]|nr:plasmid pRiA4b ORF-3 family protein [Alphaproteobacteria bacterium]